MNNHSFKVYCIDPSVLLAKPNLDNYLKVLKSQANDPLALIPYHDNTPDSDQKIQAPRYFGAGGEFLAHCFFEFFGNDYNLFDVESNDNDDRELNDGGVDITAKTIKTKIYKQLCYTKAIAGSPVYIQVKTPTNRMREFMTNDGSNIMNFYGHAQGLARQAGQSFYSRYILFTTGKSLHWKLNSNTQGMITVVNYNEIKRKIDNNEVFFNYMRDKFNLPLAKVEFCKKDPVFESILSESN
jgi:hypothetical protein